jgi:hypothetical protein
MLIPGLYDVFFLNGKEVQTEGGYYKKIIDVAIVKKGVDVSKLLILSRTLIIILKTF